ncbi:hypothetical protein IAU59_007557 [Kwoniella sp. CBS 9459]
MQEAGPSSIRPNRNRNHGDRHNELEPVLPRRRRGRPPNPIKGTPALTSIPGRSHWNQNLGVAKKKGIWKGFQPSPGTRKPRGRPPKRVAAPEDLNEASDDGLDGEEEMLDRAMLDAEVDTTSGDQETERIREGRSSGISDHFSIEIPRHNGYTPQSSIQLHRSPSTSFMDGNGLQLEDFEPQQDASPPFSQSFIQSPRLTLEGPGTTAVELDPGNFHARTLGSPPTSGAPRELHGARSLIQSDGQAIDEIVPVTFSLASGF